MRNVVIVCVLVMTLALNGQGTAVSGTRSISAMPQTDLSDDGGHSGRAGLDFSTVQTYRHGLSDVIEFVRSRTDLFPEKTPKEKRMLSTDEKRTVRTTWRIILDYCFALETLRQAYGSFEGGISRNDRSDSFVVHYAAFLAQYRHVLEFLKGMEKDPGFDTILNEADADLGLQKDTYRKVKAHFLNAVIVSEFVALNTVYARYRGDSSLVPAPSIEEDKDAIWRIGRGKGQVMTLKNALHIIGNAGSAALFPLQQNVSEWMGDTKVHRKGVSLITSEQIKEIVSRLEPGDILFERRDWYLSNIGLPGFWPHAALYVGTSQERRAFFDGDPDMCQWLKEQDIDTCDFEDLLRRDHPQSYAISATVQEDQHPLRIIEAMSEGVVFTTAEHSAGCDSLAVVRPRLSRKEKAVAIVRAFKYRGRPYDFNFDFVTDTSLVCTELVYKCYEPSANNKGLLFPVSNLMGRMVTSANDMVRQFDETYGTPQQQTEFLFFYDGIETEKKAVLSSLEGFRKSWKRPKWYMRPIKGKPDRDT